MDTDPHSAPPQINMPAQQRAILLCGIDANPQGCLADLGLKDASVTHLDQASDNLGNQYIQHASQLLGHIQQLSKLNRAHLQLVVPASGDRSVLQGLGALLRTAGLEHRNMKLQTIAVEADISDAQLADILAKESKTGSSEVRYTNGQRCVQVLDEVIAAPRQNIPTPWRNDGTYLITGGAGGLGLILSKAIKEAAPEAKLILVGRRQIPNGDLESIYSIGTNISYHAIDITEASKLQQLVAEQGPVTCVIHCAGQLRDSLIKNKSEEDLNTVLAPKVTGTLALDIATQAQPLDTFILFSSTSSVFGNPGQADYAAANGFMDSFAELRNQWIDDGRRRGHTLSINWPFWSEGGMDMPDQAKHQLKTLLGMTPLETDSGLASLNQSIAMGVDRTIILSGDQAKLRQIYATHPETAETSSAQKSYQGASIARLTSIKHALIEILCDRLKLSSAQIEGSVPFDQYGLDSVSGTELVGALEKRFGTLPKTVFFEYPTLDDLASYLAENSAADQSDLTPGYKQPVLPSQVTTTVSPVAPRLAAQASRDIAIIGISGRYPGADDLGALWAQLASGADLISEVPVNRWPADLYYSDGANQEGKGRGKWGAFIEDIESFDPLLFGISPKDASLMNPQERLFLQEVWSLLEDAGYSRKRIRRQHNGRAGVYVGAMYQQSRSGDMAQATATSIFSKSVLANRVSFFFDLEGPSVAVDTMCSSAAMAIHLACKDLIHGECELAIAGGVNLNTDPKKFIGLSHLQLLASSPDSRSFSDGDGYLPADSVGAVLLKPLPQALNDGDRIHAIIKGSATSHSGHGIGYMVPSAKTQYQVITKCLASAGVSAENISYVEAAANGSPLGDALEVSTLNKIFRGTPSIAVGTVKSNLGHSEAASGMAQVSKVVLQLKHKQLAPTIRINQLNPKIDLADSPVRFQQDLCDWPAQPHAPRRALINSFGAGGTCVSLILEEHEPRQTTASAQTTPQLIVLSAATRKRLAEHIRRMIRHFDSDPTFNLADVAYSLQNGREHLPERLAFVASTRDELIIGLREALSSIEEERSAKSPIVLINSNTTRPQLQQLFSPESGDDFVRSLAAQGDLVRVGLFWAQGGELDWSVLPGAEASHVSLPGYPFERRQFPLPPLEGAPEANAAAQTPAQASTRGTPPDPTAHVTTFLLRELELTQADIQPGRSLRDYGLESITGMALLRSINQTFGVRVEGRALLEHPTIESLAQHVQGQYDRSDSHSLSIEAFTTVQRQPPTTSFALSEGQKGLWLLQKRNPSLAAYNVPLCMRIGTTIDADLLQEALLKLAAEQPLLTCTINEVSGAPAHTLHPEARPTVERHDLIGLSEEEILARLRQSSKAPVSLESGPLMRTMLFGTDRGDVLLIILHHLIFDGRSLPLFLGRLLEIYLELASGMPQTLDFPQEHYADFVAWEQAMLDSDQGKLHRDYWHKQLKLPIPTLELPTDRRRPDGGTLEGRTVSYTLDNEANIKVKRRAARLGITPAVFYLGVYLVLLNRVSGKQDIVVGMPTVGRPEDRFNRIVGYFVNMIAIRSQISDRQPVEQFLREVQQIVADGLDHSAYPFPRLVREIRPPREKGHAPIFQVAFEYQSESIFSWRPGDLHGPAAQLASNLEYITELRQEGEFELALEIQSLDDGTRLHFKYAPEIFNQERIDALMAYYIELLDACLGDTGSRINQLPTPPHHNNAIRVRGADTGTERTPYPESKCVHHLVSQQAVKTPDLIAIRHLNTSITYAELEHQSDTLALALIANGVEPQQRVGIYVSRSPDMLVAMLAIMKAGAIYVPLDPDYPSERLRYMINDSGCVTVLTQALLQPQLHPLLPEGVVAICQDRQWSELAAQADTVGALPETDARSLVYIIYTSGSTGNPKGVMIEHRSVVNLLYSMRDEPGFRPGDRLLALATYSFDIAVVELFLPLIVGGECCLCDAETLRDGHRLKAEIERLRPDYVQATPMTWTMLLRSGWKNPDGIRMVTTGEALPTVLRDQFITQRMPVWNMYGPTETTVYATCWRVSQETPVLIGLPLRNTTAYILDDEGNPVPDGSPGELYIGGDGVARGYWNRDDLTQSRFVDHSPGIGERLYRTGDLVRRYESGELEYMGRLDDQVKIRGYRIELGEIETHLARHPDVAQCAVTVERLHDSPILIAHYVSEHDPLEESILRGYLRSLLPSYMVPARFRAISGLPQTPSGKVDRRALGIAAQGTGHRLPAASDESIEQQIVMLWRDFFSNEALEASDSFFEVGGDSMMAQSMIQALQEKLGVSLTADTLFVNDTARSLAKVISHHTEKSDTSSAHQQALNLRAEISLDPEIFPEAPPSPGKAPRNLFLTGATGFLGAYLLAELLKQTEATIHCLVRAESTREAEQRLINTLQHYQLWHDSMRSRLNPIPGRLDRPLLGIDKNTFDKLAKELDAIYHNGALINQSYPYLLLKPSNVEGTIEVLRLACQGKATPLHHISTISVQDFSSGYIQEELLVPYHKYLQGGYIQSKWVAEQLVCMAHQRGLPVTIYRPSRIVGHTDHGIMNTDDLFCRMIKSVVTLGTVPESGFYDNIIPVNDASKFIVGASLLGDSQGRALHVMSPDWYHSDQLNAFIEQEGFGIKRVPADVWLEKLESRAAEDPSHPLASLVPMFRAHRHSSGSDPLASSAPQMSTQHSDSITGSCQRILPRDLNGMLRVYFDYFYKTGFLSAPESTNVPEQR